MATNATIHRTSWPGMPPGYSDPHEGPIFSGDGLCPTCKTMLWVDWKYSTDLMRCPQCGLTFDGEQALAILSGHAPEKSQGNSEVVRQLVRMKKQLVQREAEQQPMPATQRPSAAAADSEERERLEGLIRKWESLWLLASVGKDHQQAQMIQLRISEIRRHLDSL